MSLKATEISIVLKLSIARVDAPKATCISDHIHRACVPTGI